MDFKVNGLSGMDFVRERIQECRQNETISYLVFIAGAIFFIGGFLETITSTGNPNWFLFIPYKLGPQTYNFLSLFMVLSGFMFGVIGLSSCLYYNFDKASYLDLLKEVDIRKNIPLADRGTKAFSKELMGTQRELGECKKYIMNHIGLHESDSIYYCKLLGKHWHELVEEEKFLRL